MSEYQKQCPIDGGTCGQGGTCPICENEALGSELTAAKARIAELEKALEPFAKEATRWERGLFTDNDHTSIRAGGVKEPSEVTIGDLRRAAALIKEKE